jgi:hypothetical protein
MQRTDMTWTPINLESKFAYSTEGRKRGGEKVTWRRAVIANCHDWLHNKTTWTAQSHAYVIWLLNSTFFADCISKLTRAEAANVWRSQEITSKNGRTFVHACLRRIKKYPFFNTLRTFPHTGLPVQIYLTKQLRFSHPIFWIAFKSLFLEGLENCEGTLTNLLTWRLHLFWFQV